MRDYICSIAENIRKLREERDMTQEDRKRKIIRRIVLP